MNYKKDNYIYKINFDDESCIVVEECDNGSCFIYYHEPNHTKFIGKYDNFKFLAHNSERIDVKKTDKYIIIYRVLNTKYEDDKEPVLEIGDIWEFYNYKEDIKIGATYQEIIDLYNKDISDNISAFQRKESNIYKLELAKKRKHKATKKVNARYPYNNRGSQFIAKILNDDSKFNLNGESYVVTDEYERNDSNIVEYGPKL